MLRLENYFFPFVNVVANPKYERPETGGPPNMAVDVDGAFTVDGDKLENVLNIKIRPADEKTEIPYRVELMAVGVFQALGEGDQLEKFAALNGFTMLYTAAREFILSVTGRGPWDAIQIPVHYFTPDAISHQKEEINPAQEESPSKEKASE